MKLPRKRLVWHSSRSVEAFFVFKGIIKAEQSKLFIDIENTKKRDLA
jgi:hypothetical protein